MAGRGGLRIRGIDHSNEDIKRLTKLRKTIDFTRALIPANCHIWRHVLMVRTIQNMYLLKNYFTRKHRYLYASGFQNIFSRYNM